MHSRWLISVAVLTLNLSLAAGQSKTRGASSPAPLAVGETLSYDVSWSDFITAGEMTLKTESAELGGKQVYRLVADAQSVGLVSIIAQKVRDVYESFVEIDSLRPVRVDKQKRRGRKQQRISCNIDHQRNIAEFSDGRRITVPPEVYDMVSIIYALRGIDLTPGKKRTFTVLDEGALHTIQAEPEQNEKTYTPAGRFDTTRVSIKFLNGSNVNDKYRLRLYLTRDSRRLPVLLTGEPTWGGIRMELTSSSVRQPDMKRLDAAQ